MLDTILVALNACLIQVTPAPTNCPIKERAFLHGDFLGWKLIKSPSLKITSQNGSKFIAQTSFKVADSIKYGAKIHNRTFTISKEVRLIKETDGYSLTWN